jgi:hypothetical protein
LFRTDGAERRRGEAGAPKAAASPEDETRADRYILCRNCRNRITHTDARISIQGAHRHTFANPHGIVFEIGCFQTADGCGYIGAPTAEFTWFKGYRWRVAVCRACLVHVGWHFASGVSGFVGLIIDQLIFPP